MFSACGMDRVYKDVGSEFVYNELGSGQWYAIGAYAMALVNRNFYQEIPRTWTNLEIERDNLQRGQSHEIFDPRFCSSINPTWVTD
jgi:hypothetical protein